MTEDSGREIKDRLRTDLRLAMKESRSLEVKVLRTLVAAIDNAEAPPLSSGRPAFTEPPLPGGATEVERLELSRAAVNAALSAEYEERERAAAELESRGMQERAEALRAEARIVRRYLD